MADETKVKVRLDTRQAKGELSGLVRESARTAGRVSSNIRATVGKGLGFVGIGAGVGTGLAAVRGATQSGIGDVIGEAFGPLAAQLKGLVLGPLTADAAGSRAAREETIQAFGAIAGSMNGGRGGIPPGAVEWFNNVKSLRVLEETGREAFEKDTRFSGAGVDELLKRLLAGFKTIIEGAAQKIIEGLVPFF